MTSQIATTKNAAGQWEVRRNDDNSLLGTFEDTTCRDLFLEAVTSILLPGQISIRPADATGHQRKIGTLQMAVA